jgi:hypothetical protein
MDRVRNAFLQQAAACDALGSRFTARLCRLFAERLQKGQAVADRILGWQGDPVPSADSVPLRIAGTLHALVLEGRDSLLSVAYPPDQSDDDALWMAVTHACETHADFILGRLTSAPQTNEVRRSGALLPGFLTLGQLFGRPLVLSEVGASAGLNLQWDRYRYRLGDGYWGDPKSPVLIAPEWRGNPAPDADLTVSAQAGCDLNPIDASNPTQRLRMLSYIWADQADRMARTRAALDLAAQHEVHIDKADAVDWLKVRLAEPFASSTHVVFHTIAWQYLPKHSQEAGEQLILEAGARATADAPLARLQLEADGKPDSASLTLQIWPTGEKQEIGRADFHGRWVEWRGWQKS